MGFSTHFEKYLFGHNSGYMNIKSILSPLKLYIARTN